MFDFFQVRGPRKFYFRFARLSQHNIRHFHINLNAPCLPPIILHSHCFQFLQGNSQEKSKTIYGYAKYWGVNKMHHDPYENGESNLLLFTVIIFIIPCDDILAIL